MRIEMFSLIKVSNSKNSAILHFLFFSQSFLSTLIKIENYIKLQWIAAYLWTIARKGQEEG